MEDLQSLKGQSTLSSAQLQQMTQSGAQNHEELRQALMYLQMAKRMKLVSGNYMPKTNEEWLKLKASVSEKMMRSRKPDTGDMMPTGPREDLIPGVEI